MVQYRTQTQNFQCTEKIQRLLNEQKQILNKIPDGAMIYGKTQRYDDSETNIDQDENSVSTASNLKQSIDIKYTNQTFKNMFIKKGSYSFCSDSNLDNDKPKKQFDVDKNISTLLKDIFIKRTNYSISGQTLE